MLKQENIYILLTLAILAFSCNEKKNNIVVKELDLEFDASDIQMSEESEKYINSAVDLMKSDAIYKNDIDFEKLHQVIRYYANGAKKVADTHEAIDKALPLLKDHHSSFLKAKVIEDGLGFNSDDIESIKKGIPPRIEKSKIEGLKSILTFASGKMLQTNIGYLSVPSFENLYSEEMELFADSLQTIIKNLDNPKLKGWIIDLRDNDGGAEMPMIAGIGPLLNKKNGYYGIDKSGTVRTKSFYQNGAYYNVENSNDSLTKPIVQTKINYQLKNPKLPVIVLTSKKTASSAEAVVAIFKGQANVKIVGEKTNGLTTVNSFKFLKDNSVLNLSMANMANRYKEVYVQGIEPDLLIKPSENPEIDVVLQKGLELIETE